MSRLFVIIALFVFGCATVGFAQEEVTDALDAINQRVHKAEAILQSVSKKIAVYNDKVGAQEGVVKKLKKEEKELSIKLVKISQDSEAAATKLLGTKDEMQVLREVSKKRVRSVYMNRSYNIFERVFDIKDSETIGRDAFFLAKIRIHDNQLLNRLSKLVENYKKEWKRLGVLLTEKKKIKARVSNKRFLLSKEIAKYKMLVGELGKEKLNLENSLTTLRAQSLRLETVIASLTGAEETTMLKARYLQREKKSKQSSKRVRSFTGSGLEQLKGTLSKPVQGSIVAKFGKQKVENFKDFVFNKGLSYDVPENTEVKVIAPGRIMYVGRMPGFGTIMIVDHGKRYYSLYGKLGRLLFEAGDFVESREIIAYTDKADAEKGGFYFEIRTHGAPVNPLEYLKK